MRNSTQIISLLNSCKRTCSYCRYLPFLSNDINENQVLDGEEKKITFACNLPGSNKGALAKTIANKFDQREKKFLIHESTSMSDIENFLKEFSHFKKIDFLLFGDDFSGKIVPIKKKFKEYEVDLKICFLVRKSLSTSDIIKKLTEEGFSTIYYYFPKKINFYDDFYTEDEAYLLVKSTINKINHKALAFNIGQGTYLEKLTSEVYAENFLTLGYYPRLRYFLSMAYEEKIFYPIRVLINGFAIIFQFWLEPKNSAIAFFWKGYFLSTQTSGFVFYILGLLKKITVDFLGLLWDLCGKILFLLGKIYSFFIKTYWLVDVFLKKIFWKIWLWVYPIRKIYYFTWFQVKKRLLHPFTRFVNHAGNSSR